MYNKVNLADGRTVELNGDSIVFVEERDGYAYVHLCDGLDYLTAEDFDEFLEMFEISSSHEDFISKMISRAELMKSVVEEISEERPDLRAYIKI